MKMLKYALVAAMALASVACSKWTDDERLTFDNQKDLKRAIPFIELTSADQLTAEQQKVLQRAPCLEADASRTWFRLVRWLDG